MSSPAPILEVRDLKTHFPVRGGIWLRSVATCKAVDGVSFSVDRGEALVLRDRGGVEAGPAVLGPH